MIMCHFKNMKNVVEYIGTHSDGMPVGNGRQSLCVKRCGLVTSIKCLVCKCGASSNVGVNPDSEFVS